MDLKNSKTSVLATLGTAVNALSPFVGGNNWQPIKRFQGEFLALMPDFQEITDKSLEAFTTIAGRDHNLMNEEAIRRGYDTRFQPFSPNSVGALSIFEVDLDYAYKGVDGYLFRRDGVDKSYHCVVHAKGGSKILTSEGFENEILEIEMKEKNFKIIMTHADEDLQGLFLYKKIASIVANAQPSFEGKVKAKFPKVEFADKPDVSWLKHMTCNGWTLTQAEQHNRLTINSVGVKAGSAAKVGATRSSSQTDRDFKITKPFYFGIIDSASNVPLFTALLATDTWLVNK